jgi:hypothetical protein
MGNRPEAKGPQRAYRNGVQYEFNWLTKIRIKEIHLMPGKPQRNLKILINLLPAGADPGEGRPAKGEFQSSRALARVMTGDTVTWWSNDGPFALNFQKATPFDSFLVVSHAANPAGTKHESDPMTVRKRPEPATYYYTVALTSIHPQNPGKSEVFLDSCPALVDEC